MKLYLNDDVVDAPEGATLLDLLERLGTPAQPFAMAVNAVFVPRASYGERVLQECDRIDLVIAAQGG